MTFAQKYCDIPTKCPWDLENAACLTGMENDLHMSKAKQVHLKSLLLVTEGYYYKNYHCSPHCVHDNKCIVTSFSICVPDWSKHFINLKDIQ